MKWIATITLFALAGFVSIGNASAQEHAVHATNRFSFAVDGKMLPSGTYTIT